MEEWTSVDKFTREDGKLIRTCRAPRQLASHTELVGKVILLDGAPMRVLEMMTYAKYPPPHEGEGFGLIVEPADETKE